MNRRVMIYAYTNYNLGDDLLIQTLCKRYSNVKFVLYSSPDYKNVFQDCDNLKIISNKNLVSRIFNFIGRLFKKNNVSERLLAKQCDACVCITGSLFIQGENWQQYLEYMKSRQVNGVPYFQLGSNFGPYTNHKFYEGFKDFFANCEDVCFRERYSYELFAELDNVRYAPDVIFTGKFPANKEEKQVCFSVISLKDREELVDFQEAYKKIIIDLCNYYLERNYIVNLMSFCKAEGDEIMVDEIMKEFSENERKKVITVLYQNNINEIISLISKSEVVIATRFHAMILGWCMKKKVLPIIYSPKMEHVIAEMKYFGPVVSIGEYEKMRHVIERIEDMTSFDVTSICKEAEKQFCKLDEFV